MPGFVLLMRNRGDDDAVIRIGVTVTKKIGNSVVRNRCKRRLRARNAEGEHPYQVSDADYDLFTRYFVPPGEEERFNVIVHKEVAATGQGSAPLS